MYKEGRVPRTPMSGPASSDGEEEEVSCSISSMIGWVSGEIRDLVMVSRDRCDVITSERMGPPTTDRQP